MNVLNIACIFCLVLTVIAFNKKISNFIDVRDIFVQYFKIFNGNLFQIIIIYIFPMFFSIWIVQKQLLTKEIIDDINLMVTVFTSMFFAIISILCSINLNSSNNNYKQSIKETFNSLLFEIVCCLVMLLVLFSAIAINVGSDIVKYIGSGIVYYLFIIIIFNILIIIKRFKKIFDYNFNVNKE